MRIIAMARIAAQDSASAVGHIFHADSIWIHERAGHVGLHMATTGSHRRILFHAVLV